MPAHHGSNRVTENGTHDGNYRTVATNDPVVDIIDADRVPGSGVHESLGTWPAACWGSFDAKGCMRRHLDAFGSRSQYRRLQWSSFEKIRDDGKIHDGCMHHITRRGGVHPQLDLGWLQAVEARRHQNAKEAIQEPWPG